MGKKNKNGDTKEGRSEKESEVDREMVSVTTYSPFDNRATLAGNPAKALRSINSDVMMGMSFFVVGITSTKTGGVEIKLVNDLNEAYVIRVNS